MFIEHVLLPSSFNSTLSFIRNIYAHLEERERKIYILKVCTNIINISIININPSCVCEIAFDRNPREQFLCQARDALKHKKFIELHFPNSFPR